MRQSLEKTDKSEQEIRFLILSFYQKFTVIEVEKNTLLTASDLRKFHSFSFWDSLVVSSALAAECEILYSEDMQHGFEIDGKLRIINPFKSEENGMD